MKNSTFLPWTLAGFFLLGLLASVDTCRDTKSKLAVERAKYNDANKLNAELQGQLDRQIAESIALVKAREGRIAVLEGEAVVLTNRIGHLTNALVQANEPPTTAEQEALPIVQYLRARDKMQEERFSLAMADNLKDHQVIDELRGVNAAKDLQLGAWQVKFDEEHGLRLMSEDLGLAKDRRIRALERGSIVKSVVVGAVVGTATYLIFK
jgi:hypothetical protein